MGWVNGLRLQRVVNRPLKATYFPSRSPSRPAVVLESVG